MGEAARIGRGPSVARISRRRNLGTPPSREEERVEAFRRRPRARDDALVAGETRGHGGRHRGVFLRASRAQVGYVIPWILGLGLTERPHRGPLRRRHARPRERLAMCAPCRGPERGARKTLHPPPRPRWISRAGRGDPPPTRRRASPRARAARCAHQRSRNFHRLQIVTSESGGEQSSIRARMMSAIKHSCHSGKRKCVDTPARAAMSSEPLVEARPQREGAAVVRHQSVYRCEAILVRRPSPPRDTSGPRLARFRIRRGGSSGADDDSPTLAAATPTRTSNADDAPPGARNSATSSLWTTR